MHGFKPIILTSILFVLATLSLGAAVTISGSKVICQGSATVITAPPGMYSYQWSDGTTKQSTTVWMPGKYTVIVIDSSGRLDSGSIVMIAGFNPKPMIGNPLEYLCEGDEANLEAPPYFVKYLWSTGDTTNAIRVNKNGTYSLTVTDTNGCVGTSDAVQIIVVPFPRFPLIGPTSVCRNGITPYITTNETNVVYQWTVDGGTILSGQGTANIQVSWARSGNITLKATRLRPDGGRCEADTQVFVRASARFVPEVLYSANGFCEGQSMVLSGEPGYQSYLWSTGETTPSITINKAGSYWIEVIDAGGCKGRSDTIAISMYAKPVVAINGPAVLCPGQTATLNATSFANDVAFWKWDNGQTTASINNVGPGTYTVVGTTIDACFDTASYTIRAGEAIDVVATDIHYGSVQTGVLTRALVDVTNRSAVNVSIMQIIAPPQMLITPAAPRLLPVGTTQTFTATYTASLPGPFSGTVSFVLVSADCSDTFTFVFDGTAFGDPPAGTFTITAPDTLVDVGVHLSMPITIACNPPVVADVNVVFEITVDKRVYDVQAIAIGSLTSISETDTTETFELSVPFGAEASKRTIFLEGSTLLGAPFRTDVHFSNGRFQPPINYLFGYDDGSIALRGCWLSARIVTLRDLTARVAIYSVVGTEIHNHVYEYLDNSAIQQIVSDVVTNKEPVIVVITQPDGLLLQSFLLMP